MGSALLSFERGRAVLGTAATPFLLAGAGAYTATDVTNVQDTSEIVYWITYAQNNVLGAPQVFLQESKENDKLDSFFDSTIKGTTQTPVGPPTDGTTTAVGRDVNRFPAANFKMTIKFKVGRNVLRVRLQVAEYGIVLAPGTVFIEETHARRDF